MIQLIDQLEVSLIQRFDHLEMLLLDSDQLSIVLKDDQKKRAVVKNFRIIKAAEKNRSLLQTKCLNSLSKNNRKMTKNQINICQNMFVNCMNQYLNSEYQVKGNGLTNDIIEAFIYYYQSIKAQSQVKQLKVTKNCNIFYQVNSLYQNLSYFISNTQQSLNIIYQKQKCKLFNLLKSQTRTFSPQKQRTSQQEQFDKLQKFDKTGSNFKSKKKNLQFYCFQIAKLLSLQYIYIDYFYFSAMEYDRRKKILQQSFIKRNIHTQREIQKYQKIYQQFNKRKNKKQHQELRSSDKKQHQELRSSDKQHQNLKSSNKQHQDLRLSDNNKTQ